MQAHLLRKGTEPVNPAHFDHVLLIENEDDPPEGSRQRLLQKLIDAEPRDRARVISCSSNF